MGYKYNIEEFKYLLPDLITGQISDEDKRVLEAAIEENEELSKLFSELKGADDIAESVKAVEPPAEYWNNLLPRIHARIEEKESAAFSWDKVAAYWKVLVPIAAVILIAIVYYFAVPSKTELTEKEKIEKTVKDTNKENIQNKENSQKDEMLPGITNEDKSTNDTEQKRNNEENKVTRRQNKSENDIVKENLNNNPENREPVLPNNEIENEQFTEAQLETDIEDMSVFSEGTAGGLGEDVENELSKLDDNEKSSLLQELENTNL